MSELQSLDRAKIEQAFRVMGEYLLERRALGEITIYGGSAILLQFDWRKLSMDVDARIIGGDHGLVIDAIRHAATKLGLHSSWLNESVAMYARSNEKDSDRVFVGTYPSADRVGLRVMAAKPSYMLAMKLKALDRVTADDRDFRDAIALGVECRVRTVEALRDVFRNYFVEELPFAAELRLRDLVSAIHERLNRA